MRNYLEIGTNDFDTLNDKFAGRFNWQGTSVEAVPEYFNRLVKHDKNTYKNAICTTEGSGRQMFYYVPSSVINEHGLPQWLRGCGSTNFAAQPSLQAFKQYVVAQEFDTISVRDLIKGPLDLLKIDTEGADYALLSEILKHAQPTNIIFETIFMPPEQFADLDCRLRMLGYTFRGREGDSVQYSLPSTLLIVDECWSTGSIAKDLRATMSRRIDLLDWKRYIPTGILESIVSEYDSVVAFCLSSPKGWPLLSKHGVVCCGKIEVDWVKGQQLLGGCFGTVSYETYLELLNIAPKPVYYTPASARLSRFTCKPFSGVKTLGWCGVPTSAQNFGGIDAKRFCMFAEILNLSGMQSNISGQRYTYETMQDFYHSIDALVCTSSTEGGPLGVFEAIACGIPVISTNVGLVREFDSIPKFKTAEQAVELLKDMKGLNKLQYKEMVDRMSMECLSSYWELFFRDCESLNTGRRLFF
jgi:hypothetical protein